MKIRILLVIVSLVASVLIGLALAARGGSATRSVAATTASSSGCRSTRSRKRAGRPTATCSCERAGELGARSAGARRQQRRHGADQRRREADHQRGRRAGHRAAQRQGDGEGRRHGARGRHPGDRLRPHHPRQRPRPVRQLRQRARRRAAGAVPASITCLRPARAASCASTAPRPTTTRRCSSAARTACSSRSSSAATSRSCTRTGPRTGSPRTPRASSTRRSRPTAHGIDAVLASNDGTAGGAIQALTEEGLAGKVLVTGQDAETVALQRIAAGTQAMTIYKPLQDAGARRRGTRRADGAAPRRRRQQTVDNGHGPVPSVLLRRRRRDPRQHARDRGARRPGELRRRVPRHPGSAASAAAMSEAPSSKPRRHRQALRRRDGAGRRELRPARRRGPRAVRRERRRQVHADQAAGRRASARQLRRRDPARRPAGGVPFDARRRARRHRDHLPGAGAGPGDDGRREPVPRRDLPQRLRPDRLGRGVRAGAPPARRMRHRSSTRPRRSATWASASSSWSRSRAALARKPRCWCSTSPPPRWRGTRSTRCSTLLRGLRERGVACIYISHKLDEVFAIADRITVLRDGVRAGHARGRRRPTPSEVIRRMVGRDASRISTRAGSPSAGRARCCAVRGARACRRRKPGAPALSGISFEVRAGEVLGIGGLMGAGRTELLHAPVRACGARGTAGRSSSTAQPVAAATPARGASRAAWRSSPRTASATAWCCDAGVAFNLSLSSLAQPAPRAVHRPRRARQPARTCDRRRPAHQGARPRAAGRHALRRQPAEGRARQGAADRAAGAAARRADARHRRRRQARGLRTDQPADGGGQGDRAGLQRTARTAWA